ncbi:MAG: hypothetical protein LLG08_07335 [Actinomycetia bacterium]|nr:hypothetical protein [Actinomycetes bacterium]
MSDEQDVPHTSEQVAPGTGGSVRDAWSDVVAQLGALGDAVARWARVAVNDPDNKRHAEELKQGIEKMLSSVGDATDKATGSEVGQSFKDAAEKTGDAFKVAGQKFNSEVGPHLAGAFRSASERLREAAGKMEQKADAPQADPQPEDRLPE